MRVRQGPSVQCTLLDLGLFRQGHFISIDVLAHGHFASIDVSARRLFGMWAFQHKYFLAWGHLVLKHLFQYRCQNVCAEMTILLCTVPKWPYCFVWCQNDHIALYGAQMTILLCMVLKYSCAEMSLCQKRPYVETSSCQKAPVPKHLHAKTSMETECSCARMSTEPKSPLCWKLSCQNVRYQY